MITYPSQINTNSRDRIFSTKRYHKHGPEYRVPKWEMHFIDDRTLGC